MYDSVTSRITLGAAALLLTAGGFRWSQAVAVTPDRLERLDGPTAVLLVQPGDCPDRRHAMLTWLERYQDRAGEDPSMEIVVGVIREGTGPFDDALTHLPRLDSHQLKQASRAVLRGGIPGTPALVLVSRDGSILLVDSFAPDGMGPRVLATAELLPVLTGAGPGAPDPGDPSSPTHGRREPS